MRYIIVPHARKRMQERHISQSRIEQVLNSPGQIVPGQGGRNIYQSKFTNRAGIEKLLRLVVEDATEPYVVVSVYLTTEVNRYWRP